MPDLAKVVITSVILFMVLYVGLASLSGVSEVGQEDENGIERTGDVVELNAAGEYAEVSDSLGNQETVYNSLGYAVNLTGADDSYVESESPINIATDDTWTISVGARVDAEAASDTMTAVSANGRVLLGYNGTDGNWTVWYYDEGSRDSYRVNVSAPNQPGNLSVITVRSNATHLQVFRDNNDGEVVNITTTNVADAPVESTNWNGRLDEVRTFDDALTDSERQALVDSPVAPLKDTNRTARIMFDESGASQQRIFFANPALTQSNVTFSNGFAGSEMDGQTLINDITGSTDYVWDEEGPRIYVVSGGELDGAPAAYVDYTYFPFGGAQRTFADKLGRAIGLAGTVPVIMLLVTVVGYLLLLRD